MTWTRIFQGWMACQGSPHGEEFSFLGVPSAALSGLVWAGCTRLDQRAGVETAVDNAVEKPVDNFGDKLGDNQPTPHRRR